MATALVLLLATFVLGVAPATATHFRGGTLSWRVDPTYSVSGRARIIVTYDSTWRAGFYNYPPVGQPVANPSGDLLVATAAGSSAFYSPPFVVLATEGWADSLLGRSTQALEYALTDFPLTVTNQNCCRSSQLEEGNHDASWKVQTVIPRPGTGQAAISPTIGTRFPQQISLLTNRPAEILLPMFVDAGLASVVEFAPPSESLLVTTRPISETSGFCPFATGCPTCNTSDAGPCANAVKISPDGVLTWTPQRAGSFATQVRMDGVDENLLSKARAPLDLTLDVAAAAGCSGNPQPDQCPIHYPSLSVEPAYTATEEVPLSIPLTGTFRDAYGGGNVTVGNTGPGIVAQDPISGPSATRLTYNATLNWTPVRGDAGTYEACFQAITNGGLLSEIRCTTITLGPATTCPMGSFSATGGPPCSPCPYGTFADSVGQTSCTTCTTHPWDQNAADCAYTRFYHEACTSTHDTVCEPCASGPPTSCTICSGPSASECIAFDDACEPNEYSATGAKPCTGCARGSVTPYFGSTSCTACAPGTYMPHVGPGSYYACFACLSGTFADAPGQESCTPCTTSCAPGEYLSGSCTVTADATCEACDPSCTSCSGPGPDACTSRAQCAPGTYSAAGMEPCTPCAPGSFANAEGQTSCTLCTPGTYAADAGHSACTACDPGFFAGAQGQTSCTACTAACATGEYLTTACTATVDASCGACDASCTACSGPGAAACTACATSEPPVGGACAPGCSVAPASGCRLPAVGGKGKLDIKDNTDDGKDMLKWTWAKGSATALAEFGDPVTDDGYFLCVYDAGVRVSSTALPAGGTCGKNPCWAAKKTSFNYKDTERTPDGALTAKLGAGAAGKATISVQAKGVNLETPDLTTLTGPIRVQLQRADGGLCFESVFGAPFKKNAKGTFSDLAD